MALNPSNNPLIASNLSSTDGQLFTDPGNALYGLDEDYFQFIGLGDDEEWNLPQNTGIDCPPGQTKNLWGNCVNDVDPWPGFEGDWGYEPTDLETEVSDYWTGLQTGFAEHGLDYSEFSEFFDPYSTFWAGRAGDLGTAATQDIGQLQLAYQLLQAQAVSERAFTAGQDLAAYNLTETGLEEAWEGQWNPETNQFEWGALQALRAQETGLGTIFGLDYGELDATIDCQTNPELCGELGRQLSAAGSIWAIEKAALEQLGLDETAIATLRSSDLVQRGLDATALWGLEEDELERLKINAQDIWDLEKAEIERERRGAISMWGLQETGLKEGWEAEKEELEVGTRRGLDEYRRKQEETISGRGFATGATGLEYIEEDIHEDYGRRLETGEEELSRQLGMGREQLTQTVEGFTAQLGIGEEKVEDILEGYGAQINIGAERLDATIEGYLREGLIDDAQASMLQKNITEQIDIGAQQFLNLGEGADAERISALANYNINIANVQHQINSGEMSVDQAVAENLLSYNQAIQLGLMTEAHALATGATQYQIATEDVFEDLQQDIWGTIENWRSEQENILQHILHENPATSGDGTSREDLCPGVVCGDNQYLVFNTCSCKDFEDSLTYSDLGTTGDCVISTHALSTGGMLKSDQLNAVDWCTKTLHGKWWGEAMRRGYRYLGRKHIANKTAETIYKEFKECLEWANGKRPFELKIAARYYWRILQTFIVGLFVREK